LGNRTKYQELITTQH